MPDEDTLQNRLLEPVIPFRDRVIAWMDPITMKPEQRKARRRFVITVSVIVVLGIFVGTALTRKHINNRCPEAPAGVIMYDVPTAASLSGTNLKNVARTSFSKYQGAREMDFCSADDGTILQRFLSTEHKK